MRAESLGESPHAGDMDQIEHGRTPLVRGLCPAGSAAEGAAAGPEPLGGAGAEAFVIAPGDHAVPSFVRFRKRSDENDTKRCETSRVVSA
jgi:hypothetical protein